MSKLYTEVYFSLGSNLGNRMEFLKYGVGRLSEKLKLLRLSPIYETESWGYADPNPYLNMVAKFSTSYSAEEIMKEIAKIERDAGRITHVDHSDQTYEARTLDIDILFYGDRIYNNSMLKIPHPRLHLRNFVLFPFVDIDPDYIHPVIGCSIESLKKQSLDTSKIHCFAERL